MDRDLNVEPLLLTAKEMWSPTMHCSLKKELRRPGQTRNFAAKEQ